MQLISAWSFFTFQYGSTLMGNHYISYACFCLLYIPIWFYFNCSHLSCKLSLNVLYIPIWFYFNEICILPAIIAFKLYIPIWFYFNVVAILTAELAMLFTFQYGSTLISGTAMVRSVCFTLHSNMVLL